MGARTDRAPLALRALAATDAGISFEPADATDAVVDVLFDRIDGLDAHQLGASFMEANHHAQALLQQRVEALSETYYGKDSGTTEVMREQYRAMFPNAAEPPQEHRPRPEIGGLR